MPNMEDDMARCRTSAGRKYTYADYLTWPEEGRWEIVDGEAFDMTPGPGRLHQEVSMGLERQIAAFLEGKPCRMFHAPFDVVFLEKGKKADASRNVFQPDIFVTCNPERLTEQAMLGAPDFIIEILSPATASIDHVRKRRVYEKHGVREFWLVHPTDRTVLVYRLGANELFEFGGVHACDGLELEVSIFPGLVIDFGRAFPPTPKVVRETPPPYGSRSGKSRS